MSDLYFKTTRRGGKSETAPHIIYRVGMVVHPDPDRESKSACGKGIHLWKTLKEAERFFVSGAEKEIYLASPGVILGEDSTKIRCASCDIIKKLRKSDKKQYMSEEEKAEEIAFRESAKQQKLLEFRRSLGINGVDPLCGVKWVERNIGVVTQEDIDKCRLEVSVAGKRVLAINPAVKLKKGEFRAIIKSRVG